MRVLAYIPLMYGAEYLSCCIKSMHDFVDKIIVVYTDKPSQGYATNIPCPESEEMLKEIAFASSDKIEWHKQNFATEGEHRNYIYQFSAGYDLVFSLDADEVADPNDIRDAFQQAIESPYRYIGISGFINLWKSFNYACFDSFTPIRITNLHRENTGVYGVANMRIYHFSTAQNIETIKYKWNISGHKSELRPNWIEDIYGNWTPENNYSNLHPVALDLWNATKFDKASMPEILNNHINYGKYSI